MAIILAALMVAGPLYVITTGHNPSPDSLKSSTPIELSNLNSSPSSSAQVNPFLYYSSEPAPMGVADFGIGANGNPYEYQTDAFLGVVNITSLSTYNSSFPAGSRHWMSFQMNVVLEFSYGGNTYAYWVQDVAQVDTLTNYFSFIDNVWNFSSPNANIQTSTLVGNGTVASSGGTGYYYDWASSLPGNNISLTYPAVVKFAVSSSTGSSGPEVTFMYNDGYGWQTYDNVHFVFAPNPTADYGFVVDGYNYAPSGNYFDAELILGGPGGGLSTNDNDSQVQLQLEYWNGHNYQLTPSAYNFGSDTAETIGNVVSSEYHYTADGMLFTNVTASAGTLGQIYNQATVSFLNVKSLFTFQGSISGTLYVNSTEYSFVGGDVNLTLEPGTYNLQLYSDGILYWLDNAVTLSPGQVLNLNAGYTVTFAESGLPAGQSWSIKMSNETGASVTLSSTSARMTFVVPMGHYSYTIDVVNGYSPTMIENSGNISQNTVQSITFVKWPASMISTGSSSFPLFALYDPSNGYVYVSNNNASSIDVFNGNSVVQVINTGSYPGELVYDPSNGNIYALLGSGIDVINPSSGGIGAILSGYYFSAMAYDSANSYLYATGNDNITVINPATGSVINTIALNFNPDCIAYDANNNYLYLTNMNNNAPGGNITVLNPQTSGMVSVIAVSYEPLWVIYNAFNNEIYAAGFNYNIYAVGMNVYSVPGSVSDISGTSIVKTITVGYAPGMMTFNPSNGQVYVSNLFSDNVTVINGSTNTVIRSIAVGYYPIGVAYDADTGVLYVANAFSGNVALINTIQIYSVMFSESGLPSGTSWSVTLNGATEASTSSTITFSEPNGTYGYTVSTPISGGSGVRYVNVSSGSVTVNGNNAGVAVSYTTQYYLTTYSSPSTGGTTSPLSGWYNASSTVTISATPVSGYVFLSWTGSGSGNYTGKSSSQVITMDSPITETAYFGRVYNVTFTESSLPSGAEWFVNLSNGQSFNGSTTTITFNEANGTYSFSIATTNKSWFSGGGSFTINGSSASQSVTFTEVTYNVTLTESGLPSGTSWSVTLEGKTSSFTTVSAVFALQNGTYTFTIGNVSGYSVSPSALIVKVDGAGVSKSVSFSIIKGYLTGSVEPSTATVSVDGTVVAVVNGQFNVTLSPGTYEVEATHSGYNNYYNNITVTGGQSTHLAISMTRHAQSSPSNILSGSILYIGIGIAAIAVAAVVAIAALSRRKKLQ
ncbi:MAG: thermopsin family protease [Thermoplasmata archaeon]|uniref:Thermopsin family protease n=1 Tax=Candidatus Sysuiplasma superficiale TaxID=2823368 RepID=A0A8J7YXT2_9ARCH|nr:thermopsin family protease [Candidatus Sysuiplasma superficiale]